MGDLVVAILSFGFVGEKLAKLSEESLPVAGNILHLQVVENEFLPSAGRGRSRKSDTALISHKRLSRESDTWLIQVSIKIQPSNMIRYLVAISCAMSSFSLTNCRSSLRTQDM